MKPLQIQSGIECPACGHLIEDVTQVEVKTSLSRRDISLGALVGLALGILLASLPSDWKWTLTATVVLTMSLAFMLAAQVIRKS